MSDAPYVCKASYFHVTWSGFKNQKFQTRFLNFKVLINRIFQAKIGHFRLFMGSYIFKVFMCQTPYFLSKIVLRLVHKLSIFESKTWPGCIFRFMLIQTGYFWHFFGIKTTIFNPSPSLATSWFRIIPNPKHDYSLSVPFQTP